MVDAFKKGDKVSWNYSGNKVHGTVTRKVEQPTSIKGHDVAASPEHPEYEVESDKTGKAAIHKAEALTKEK